MEYTDDEEQTDLAWEQRIRQEWVGADERAEAPGRFEKIGRPSAGLRTHSGVKMLGVVGPGLQPSKRGSDGPEYRGTGGSLCSAGLWLLVAQFLSFRTRSRRRKGVKEATGERKRRERPLRPRVNSDPAPGPSSHSPLDAGPDTRGPGGPGSVSWRGSPGCAWTGRSTRV